jgi:hypothetical protein
LLFSQSGQTSSLPLVCPHFELRWVDKPWESGG